MQRRRKARQEIMARRFPSKTTSLKLLKMMSMLIVKLITLLNRLTHRRMFMMRK